jgi:large subunit ribosomal protein L17
MAVGRPKYRHLGRTSAHRQALLRNLIDALFTHESITTTWAKAKEAQRLAEKMITLAKKNTEETRRKAYGVFYVRDCVFLVMRLTQYQRPQVHMPKLFGELTQRYTTREKGYTRVMRIEPTKEDQAESAILEFVDGPRDMKFMLTARTLAYRMRNNLPMNENTALNVKKVTQYRKDGVEELRGIVARMVAQPQKYLKDANDEPNRQLKPKRIVYPDPTLGEPLEEMLIKRDKKRKNDPLLNSAP